jgi:hypothetical protein
MTLILGSPEYVTFPTVSSDTLSTVRRTHMTYQSISVTLLILSNGGVLPEELLTVLSFSIPTLQFKMDSVPS